MSREADLASVELLDAVAGDAGTAPRLRVTAPAGIAGSQVPITLETCGGATSLETVPGSPGWYRYQGASAPWTRRGSRL